MMFRPPGYGENSEVNMTPDSGFTDSNGQHVKHGDTVRYSLRGVTGKIVEILQDGDGTIELDDGKLLFVKWCHLTKVV